MEDRKEKIEWLSVPQFGDWDQKHDLPDYSLDFSKIREMRKQHKRDTSRASLGNEEELISKQHNQHEPLDLHHPHHNDSPTVIALMSLTICFNVVVKLVRKLC